MSAEADPRRRPVRQRPRLTTAAAVVLLTLAYVGAIFYAYAVEVAPLFSYLGFRYRSPEIDSFCYALLITLALALALPRALTRPSHVVLWLLFVLAVVPSLIIPQFADVIPPDEALRLASVTGASFAVTVWGVRQRLSPAVPLLDLSSSTLLLVLLGVSSLIYGYVFATVGLSTRLLSLSAVYDVRAEFKSDTSGAPLLGYLVPLQGNVINPFLMLTALRSRNHLLLVAGMTGQLVLYSGTGFRSLLFSTPALFAVALLFRRRAVPSGASIVLGAIGLVAACVALDRLLGTIAWTSLFVRRLILYPGLLTAAYVSVFADRPKGLFAQSVLSPFVSYPYDADLPALVGRYFVGGEPGTSANANLFGDGYANMGYPGIAVESLVLLVLLRLMDSASRGLPVGVAAPLFVMPAITLANSSVFTGMLTHGIAAAIALAACTPRATSSARLADPRHASLQSTRLRRSDGVSGLGTDPPPLHTGTRRTSDGAGAPREGLGVDGTP